MRNLAPTGSRSPPLHASLIHNSSRPNDMRETPRPGTLIALLCRVVPRITQPPSQEPPVFPRAPLPDRRHWLTLATVPFVVGAMMGCTHSLVAALFLTVLQLTPPLSRVRATRLEL